MTASEWKALPPLIRRGQVVAVGITPDVIRERLIVVESETALDAVPYGSVAAVKLGGQLRYVKATISRLLAREYRN